MPNNSKTSRSKESESLNFKNIIISSIIGLILFFLIISFLSFAALKTDLLNKSSYMPVGLLSAAISAFASGFLTVRKIKKNGVLFGALTGLVQALITSLSVFFINNRNSGTGIFILIAVFVLFGAIGGMSAVNLKVRKKYK